MVLKIMQPASSSCFSLEYNESKCATGEAVLLHTNCIDESEGIAETFRKYERRNIRTENLSFHMSVNPAPDERLTEEQVKEFISDIMKGVIRGIGKIIEGDDRGKLRKVLETSKK